MAPSSSSTQAGPSVQDRVAEVMARPGRWLSPKQNALWFVTLAWAGAGPYLLPPVAAWLGLGEHGYLLAFLAWCLMLPAACTALWYWRVHRLLARIGTQFPVETGERDLAVQFLRKFKTGNRIAQALLLRLGDDVSFGTGGKTEVLPGDFDKPTIREPQPAPSSKLFKDAPLPLDPQAGRRRGKSA